MINPNNKLIATSNQNVEKEKLMSTTEIANILHTSNKVILENAKKLFPNKKFENGKITYFNEKEASEIIKNIGNSNASKEPLLQSKGQVKTEILLQEEFNKTLDGIKNLSRDNKLKIGLGALQSLLEDLQNENKELKNDNNIIEKENIKLREKENERLYIENEKYKSKELRKKINKAIREYCYSNNLKYGEEISRLYRIYDNIHCFRCRENYKGYINIIEDRHHLKEFYNIVLNNL